MPEFLPIPIPGSARARLLASGIARFQELGFERASVVDIARDAGVTTGSLYHHFKNKIGLYMVIRDEMETRMTERMEGASSAVGGAGRPAIQAGLEVAFDAAVRLGVTRILAEPCPDERPDAIASALSELLPLPARPAGAMLAAAWRAALLAVAEGASPAAAKAGMGWVLNTESAA
jgi:AcrR family transcriptional regulator